MFSFKLPTLNVFFSILFMIMVTPVYACEASAKVFAQRVMKIITTGDVDHFMRLNCFPNDCIQSEETEYIFGSSENAGFIVSFLKRDSIKTKVYGPINYNFSGDAREYVVVYFDSELVKFSSGGFLSEQDREELWWKGYVETVITVVDGEWGFSRTPFYYGTEPPWLVTDGL